MKQTVLKGKEIYAELSLSLTEANSSINVVSAWFTDQDLLDILILKQEQGVSVSLVIGDNKDNHKLDFNKLCLLGGSLKRVKGKGFGMMHQKYCIIDNKVAFHGSYNWTVNARKNNSESVIKTNHKATLKDLLEDFKKLNMENATTSLEGENKFLNKVLKNIKPSKTETESVIEAEEPIVEEEVVAEKIKVEPVTENTISVDDVFTSIITAEAKSTDEESLKKKGYELSKEVSGDHNVLSKSMNSLYHVYIADNSENEELKGKLSEKITKKKEELIQLEEINRSKQAASDEVFNLTKQKEYAFEKTTLEKELNLTNKDIEINKEAITSVKEKIEGINDKITGLELDFMKPAFNWLAFLPYAIFILGLGTYLMLFYSSSLYIMIYSLQDSMELIKMGVPLEDINPQVFDSGALSKSFAKEGIAGIFILLFFFVPLVIAYVSHLKSDITDKRNKLDIAKMFFCYLVVIFIDGFIAAKVTHTIIEIQKAAKQLPPDYEMSFGKLLSDLNFWLVFCLGALPFIFLSILIDKLSMFFKERSPETEKKKLKYQKKYLDKKNQENYVEIEKLENSNKEKERDVIRINNEMIQIDRETTFLPLEVDNMKKLNNDLADKKIDIIKNKASMYLNDVDNDNFSVSFSTLNHRISAFIEGWNEWLHDEYSIEKATQMSENAETTIDIWLDEKSTLVK